MTTPRRTRPCGRCGSANTRPYADGYRCPIHTPAAVAGVPEPGEGRYCSARRCYCGGCPQWTPPPTDTYVPLSVIDLKHIASGKRRSSPHVYAGARATIEGVHAP
ncbi:hypothetical protein ACIBSV_12220 [Embleya sp. NPDC050154]|uniref:hypothetical protein n=1 Tax=Embleya sp. NPDC050154 TaxID=3363988 RepID=UPI0037ACC6C0